ncbi:MAG: nickel pincer cofactor biosynthesis protein LarB [Thermomicrobiales bacterium]|nr:nickel pincer cofactor biosynthesis protein LarB [Thermomicrobiales bacterium]
MERRRPFDDLRAALDTAHDDDALDSGQAPALRLDLNRRSRAGIPEIVHAEHKDAETVAAALVRLAERNGRALASRCAPELAEAVVALLGGEWEVAHVARARALVVVRPGATIVPLGGRVAILTAGSSDAPVAAEAALVAREMGATTDEAYDVGVAGLHRLVGPLERMARAGADVYIVAAGMDGALPSVVAGLVDAPVIGLPTSVGYGIGAGGLGALTTMLQSCAPGLVVVNVDNGVGAGSTAALIANRVAAGRRAIQRGDEISDDRIR